MHRSMFASGLLLAIVSSVSGQAGLGGRLSSGGIGSFPSQATESPKSTQSLVHALSQSDIATPDTEAEAIASLFAMPATPEGRAALAMSTSGYPVTPGDQYLLTILSSSGPINTSALVDADGMISFGPLGSFNTRGVLFSELRTNVEKAALAGYPRSSPQLVLKGAGTFPIFVQGEVKRAGPRYVWGLSRLSDLWDTNLTTYASSRLIQIIQTGKTIPATYDLYLAWRFGDLSQNPLLRPNDIVVFTHYDRSARLSGAVNRPGIYQLLPGENCSDLIEKYGSGLLPSARPDLAMLVRKPSSENPLGSSQFFHVRNANDIKIQEGDYISIPGYEDFAPVVYFEGAVVASPTAVPDRNTTPIATGRSNAQSPAASQITQSTSSQPVAMGQSVSSSSLQATPQQEAMTDSAFLQQYASIRQIFHSGDQLSRAIRAISSQLLPSADLRRAFIARKGTGQTIPVNLEKLLFSFDPKDDVALEPDDHIVIPFGSMNAFLTGEVTRATWLNVTALARLRDLVAPMLTKYSSTRDIHIRSENGNEAVYDLFQAERNGDLSHNPYVRPGDTITIKKLERAVSISGEVKKPGTYQILPEENLREVIEIYANGFTEKANPQRLSLIRYISTSSIVGEKIQIDYLKRANFVLMNYDSIVVSAAQDLSPVAYFEGALGVGINGEDPQAARRIVYTFFPGESLSQAVQSIRKQFSAVSEIRNAYIIRNGNRISIDLSKFLFDKDFSNDIALEQNDVVIVPFRQFFVSVSGAVKVPGRYPFVPDRDWRYYVGLAGGFDTDKNTGQVIEIIDLEGKGRSKSRLIQPEDSIIASSNSFLYNFQRISYVVTTLLSVVSIILAVRATTAF